MMVRPPFNETTSTRVVAWFPALLSCVLLLGVFGDAEGRGDLVTITGVTMGTTYAVKLHDADVESVCCPMVHST